MNYSVAELYVVCLEHTIFSNDENNNMESELSLGIHCFLYLRNEVSGVGYLLIRLSVWQSVSQSARPSPVHGVRSVAPTVLDYIISMLGSMIICMRGRVAHNDLVSGLQDLQFWMNSFHIWRKLSLNYVCRA